MTSKKLLNVLQEFNIEIVRMCQLNTVSIPIVIGVLGIIKNINDI